MGAGHRAKYAEWYRNSVPIFPSRGLNLWLPHALAIWPDLGVPATHANRVPAEVVGIANLSSSVQWNHDRPTRK